MDLERSLLRAWSEEDLKRTGLLRHEGERLLEHQGLRLVRARAPQLIRRSVGELQICGRRQHRLIEDAMVREVRQGLQADAGVEDDLSPGERQSPPQQRVLPLGDGRASLAG